MSIENSEFVRELVRVAHPWNELYGGSTPIEIGVIAVHVLSMLVAGGLAIAHDRGTLRSGGWSPSAREHHLDELRSVHPAIIAGLTLCFLSGAALFAADVKTYVVSIPYWVKMALIVLLLGNALFMTRTERTIRSGFGTASIAWSRLRAGSLASAGLWCAIVFVSIVLSNSK